MPFLDPVYRTSNPTGRTGRWAATVLPSSVGRWQPYRPVRSAPAREYAASATSLGLAIRPRAAGKRHRPAPPASLAGNNRPRPPTSAMGGVPPGSLVSWPARLVCLPEPRRLFGCPFCSTVTGPHRRGRSLAGDPVRPWFPAATVFSTPAVCLNAGPQRPAGAPAFASLLLRRSGILPFTSLRSSTVEYHDFLSPLCLLVRDDGY